MGFFSNWRNKKRDDKSTNGILENKKAIKEMAAHVDSILVGIEKLSMGDKELVKRFRIAQDSIRYFNPTTDKRALKEDSEILSNLNDILNDIKVAVAKSEDVTEKIALKLLKIEMSIPERKRFSE